MTGGIEGSSSSVQSLDSLKQTLEQSLSEINKSISMGIREIKTDLSDQVQTILIAIPRQNTTQGSSGVSFVTGNLLTAVLNSYRSVDYLGTSGLAVGRAVKLSTGRSSSAS
jgi:hypothetical protein